MISRPVRDVIEDVIFHQGLDFSLFGVNLARCNDCNSFFGIKPADLFTTDIIHSKNSSVELMWMLFLLDGPDGFKGLIVWQVYWLLVRHLLKLLNVMDYELLGCRYR